MEQNDHTLSALRDLTGQRLGSCLLERLIGQGGMGEVYLARQEHPERRVAVKTLRATLSMDGETIQQFRTRFQREANLIARLDHVNIVPIYEYGEQAGIAYLVMPYLTGGSLRDLLHQRGAFSPTQALTYLEQAAKALDYAHGQGIIHRDLKPANFLLHADGRLVLADFGIARMLVDDNQSGAGSTLTGTGILLGTPEYMAPEMVRGEPLDKRADVYELGIVLYQMLSGSVPFKGNTPLMVAAMQLQQSLPSLHASHPALPAAADAVLQRATAKMPEQRFPSAGALAQAFREALFPPGLPALFTSMNAVTLPAQHPLSPAAPVREAPLPGTQPTSGSPLEHPSSVESQPMPSVHSASENTFPQTPYPPVLASQPQRSRSRQPWLVLLGILLIAILVVGGVLIGLQLNHGNATAGLNQGTGVTQPAGVITPAIAHDTPTLLPTATPVQSSLPKGSALYTTNAPGAIGTGAPCDGGAEQWANYNAPVLTCQAGHVTLYNSQQALAGLLLVALPNNAPYPSNYVVEAQMQENTSSQADFGLYFRNQPGNAQGVYTFLIHADGSWVSYVYNNATGAPTQVGSGSAGIYAHAQVTLDVAANGSSYTFYVDGQQVGQVNDPTYQSGTAGIALDAGGTIEISSFALYAFA